MDPSSSASHSLVSRAKAALHSATEKAEKVINDIKSDLKNDHNRERGENQPPKEPEDAIAKQGGCVDEESSSSSTTQLESKHKSKYLRWNLTNLGKNKDKKQSYLIIDKGHKCVEVEKVEESTSHTSHDKNILQKQIHAPEAEGDDSIISKMVGIPSAAVIKQLAVAIESMKNWSSMRDLLTSTSAFSPVNERSSLSFSVVKSLVLREKEKSVTESCNEDIISLVLFLFNSEDHLSSSSSVKLPIDYFPRDIHGAPPESFVVRLSRIIGNLRSLQKMVLFWSNVVTEMRRLWLEGKPIPHVPFDDKPDLKSCHLYQHLQVINCCIARKRRQESAIASLDSLLSQSNSSKTMSVNSSHELSSSPIFARNKTGDLLLRLGADHQSENLTMLETNEPIYSPVTQEGPILTEEFIRESEEFILRTGSLGDGVSQLLSDMQAFKAANPGCILEDFVRWHSPPDWTETEVDEDCIPFEEESSIKRGRLSRRMQKEGNLWRELWEAAKALPAVKQTPLFDEDLAVESIFITLDDISPSELFEQLFLSALYSGLVIAESSLSTDSNLHKLFCDCKDYIFSACQSGLSNSNIKDICKVYYNIEMIATNPEEASEIVKMSKDSSLCTSGESERRNKLFKILNINFSGKVGGSEDEKKVNGKDGNTTNVFTNLFDGKASSLFSRKNSKSDSSTASSAEQQQPLPPPPPQPPCGGGEMVRTIV